ncbi:hypothetical protein [Arcticibacterium luteifluviistationis]|uniref:Apea-like HEPN domain-containing protein n=1 Tax=Arcticibacterium luteifluviistationis TaxID=1784714 RepID=A0A2Z4G7J1_9BACT|nr:hypothetical protein [Arcticibacterium luteifluviistationis]AWV97144.1 hypothetical protein DJ013_02725 [Arcticibacterium luteifluviistationis]
METPPFFPYDPNQKPFAFLNYPIELVDFNDHDLGDGFRLRHANLNEKTIINWYLQNYFSSSDAELSHNARIKKTGKDSHTYERIEFDKINYTVIEIESAQNANHPIDSTRIQLAVMLFKRRLSIMFTLYWVKNTTVAKTDMMQPYLFLPSDTMQVQRILNIAEELHYVYKCEPLQIDSSQMIEIQGIKNKIFNISKLGLDPKEYTFLSHSYKTYIYLNEISISSRFRILALFSVLEGLLIDSNKDISRKAQFIKDSIDNLCSSDTNLKKIIKLVGLKGPDSNTLGTWIFKAYKYRNSIAHGYEADFNSELKLFNKQFQLIQPMIEEVLIATWKNLIADPKSFLEWRNEMNEKPAHNIYK